jgi:hypothetical protein
MNDNIIPFPIPEKKSDLDSPEIEKMMDDIVKMTKCKGLILSTLNDNEEVSVVRVGNINTQQMINMSCAAIYRAYEAAVQDRLDPVDED